MELKEKAELKNFGTPETVQPLPNGRMEFIKVGGDNYSYHFQSGLEMVN